MYAFIRGLLVEATPVHAILDAGGIGYQIHIPSTLASRLDPGATVLLYTSFIVREGFQGLYGFIHEDERNLFNEVIEISGIGPKIALGLISHMSISQLHDVIQREDALALSKIPGIGKKTAERLLIELRNRLEKFFLLTPTTPVQAPKQQNFSDALKALINLGYNRNAAEKALKKSLEDSKDFSLAELISTSLRYF
jgi:Holliday junction DNA helicase RuvA